MAWTHFTDWLEPGETISKEQADELFSAYSERARAIGEPGPVSNASYYPGRRVEASRDFGQSIKYIGQFYYPETSAGVPRDGLSWNNSSSEILFTAGSDLGLSSTDVNQILDIGGSHMLKYSNCHHTWNLLRRALQLMHYIKPTEPTWDSYNKNGDWFSTWSAAKTDFYAASEVAASSGSNSIELESSHDSTPGRGYEIQAFPVRSIGSLSLPIAFSTLSFEVVVEVNLGGGFAGAAVYPATIVMESSSGQVSEVIDPSIDGWLRQAGLVGQTLDLEFFFKAAEDEITMDAEFKPAIDEYIHAVAGLDVYLKPTFTHPYEEIV